MLILPQWYCILDSLSLDEQVIPYDIRTRWNATYDMLDCAYEYRKAINEITDIWYMKLQQYKIDTCEWEIVRQLHDLLKVSFFLLSITAYEA